MKIIRILAIILFFAVILAPVAWFNTESGAISEIDNRMLAENPFTDPSGDLTKNVENYVSDRIGFRDEMILSYTLLNDRLFDKMVHPSYSYGRDGYVFGAGITTNTSYTHYHEAFVNMVEKLQAYCQARGVPFLFVFNPAKPAVETEYLADGINYDRSWVDQLMTQLDERGINYIDLTVPLRELRDSGVAVFNQKYDANHWNALGAYYGTRAMLEKLSESCERVHINEYEEFSWSEEVKDSLLVSNFPINESVPVCELRVDYETLTSQYKGELKLDPSYRSFGYYTNPIRASEGAPSALVFQGSYMNNYGYPFLIHAFGEYAHIHDYQNVMELPYYYGIFQPDVVIFEVAEYTLNNTYFDYENMLDICYNPALCSVPDQAVTSRNASELTIEIEEGEALTEIRWKTNEPAEYVWMILGREYDMHRTEDGYAVTVKTSEYRAYADELTIVSCAGMA